MICLVLGPKFSCTANSPSYYMAAFYMIQEKLAGDASNCLTGMFAEKWPRYGAPRSASGLLEVMGEFVCEASS